MYKIMQIAKRSIFKTMTQSRFYFSIFLNFILIRQLTETVKSFSETVHIKTTPWLFPFFMQNTYIQLMFVLGIVLLFCDAPYIDGGSFFEVIRAGKQQWILGKIVYTWLMSGIYTFFIILITICLLLPQITWENSWGKVLGTLAQTNAAQAMGNSSVSLDYNLMIRYKPLQAMLFSFLIAWTVSFLIAMCIMFLNLFLKKIPGVVGGLLIGTMSLLQKELSNIYVLTYFSPVSWMDIHMWNYEVKLSYPTPFYMKVFLLTTILGLSVCTYVSFVRREEAFTKWRKV